MRLSSLKVFRKFGILVRIKLMSPEFSFKVSSIIFLLAFRFNEPQIFASFCSISRDGYKSFKPCRCQSLL